MVIYPRFILTSLIAVLLATLAGVALAAEIDLSVQPEHPLANESFRLVFSADEAIDAEPNFSELETVVEILGRNRQTSIKWINGKNSQSTTWILEVIAPTPGALSIPAIAFGRDRSRATVIELRGDGSGIPPTNSGLQLEIEVDNRTPYVQQQVILTARLLRRVEIHDAKLTDPSTSTDTIIKRLGKDATYQTTRNGKRYEVFERRYSIFPQTSGTVTINPLLLTTQIVPTSRSLFNPFPQSLRTRRIQSNAIVLEVKPIPPSYTGDTWLPARRLRLRDDWSPNEANVNAGEPLTRTVFLWADGLTAGQLPEVPIPLPAGVKIYPDQPQTSEQESATGYSAIRQQKYAIIPRVAAELLFPETSISWWNTETDQMETARLKARRFMVQGPSVTESSMSSARADDQSAPLAPTIGQSIATEIMAARGYNAPSYRYVTLAIVCLVGWIATAFAWWWRSRRRARSEPASYGDTPLALARARRDVLGACKADDPAGTKRALVAWGRVALDDPRLSTLGDLIARVGAPLDKEIRHLDRCLYGNRAGSWDRKALHQAFKRGDIRPHPAPTEQNIPAPLPELFRLSGP